METEYCQVLINNYDQIQCNAWRVPLQLVLNLYLYSGGDLRGEKEEIICPIPIFSDNVTEYNVY